MMINRFLIPAITLFLAYSPITYAVTADDVVCDKCVDTTDLAGKSVSTNKLKNKAVKTRQIGDAAVTADKIGDAAVTADKIGVGAVTVEKLADGVYGGPHYVVKDKNDDPVGFAIPHGTMNKFVNVFKDQAGLQFLLRVQPDFMNVKDPPTLLFTTTDCSDGPWVEKSVVDDEVLATFSMFDFVASVWGKQAVSPFDQNLLSVYRPSQTEPASNQDIIRENTTGDVDDCVARTTESLEVVLMDKEIDNLIVDHPPPYALERVEPSAPE